ncbi:MAG: hypothetical protein IPM53_03705 [Anaerolineaceae bacterium]|nr:hypothetical protein [Anaerolineaceae bacterium]
MSGSIVPKSKKITEITLIRHNHFFFYTLRINGRTEINGKPISRERAKEIFDNNQDGKEQYVSGQINFDPEAFCQWAWTVTRIEELD